MEEMPGRGRGRARFPFRDSSALPASSLSREQHWFPWKPLEALALHGSWDPLMEQSRPSGELPLRVIPSFLQLGAHWHLLGPSLILREMFSEQSSLSRIGKETAWLDELVMERQGDSAVRCTGHGVLSMWKMGLRALRSVRSLDTKEAHTQTLCIFWSFMELVALNKTPLRFIRGPGICTWFLFSLWTSGTASRAMKLNVQQIQGPLPCQALWVLSKQQATKQGLCLQSFPLWCEGEVTHKPVECKVSAMVRGDRVVGIAVLDRGCQELTFERRL